MRKQVFTCAIQALFFTGMTAAQAAPFSATDLAAEEGKFAAYSVQHGMRDAFIEFFADDSLLLRPDPVDGRAYMRAQKNPPIVLDWKTQVAVLSASRDMGMSTGPSIVRSKTDPTQAPSYGQFLSVWQKQKDGTWRVLLDHGISQGDTAAPDKPLLARDLPAGIAGGDTTDAEAQFARRSTEAGIAAAYAAAATPHTRLLRDDRMPIDGAAAIAEFMKSADGVWKWATLKKGGSLAGDFSYAVGTYDWQPKEGALKQGHFIRVWVREIDSGKSRWTLAGEVLTPRPVPKN